MDTSSIDYSISFCYNENTDTLDKIDGYEDVELIYADRNCVLTHTVDAVSCTDLATGQKDIILNYDGAITVDVRDGKNFISEKKRKFMNKLKQPIHIKKIKIIRKVVLESVFLIIILFGAMKICQYYNRNPYLIELQQIVAEQYGTDFSVKINYSKYEKISEIVIEATDEIYSRSDVFSKVDKIQKIVYEYVMQNQEQFCDVDSISPEYNSQLQEKEGLEVSFRNSEYYTESSGLLRVFCFYNRLDYKNENAEGFNCLWINEIACRSDSHYSNIKTSVLVNFSDINYLQCWYIFVDDLSFIERMKNLKEISVDKYNEEIKKAAKEAGIKCN